LSVDGGATEMEIHFTVYEPDLGDTLSTFGTRVHVVVAKARFLLVTALYLKMHSRSIHMVCFVILDSLQSNCLNGIKRLPHRQA